MSVTLDPVDLSSYVAGSTGRLDWSASGIEIGAPAGVPAGRATLRFFNESGCVLKCSMSGSSGMWVTAGGWGDYILHGQTRMDFSCDAVIPNGLVNKLYAQIYVPGEPVPPVPNLGNSPIGISGNVGGSGTSSFIKNDGAAPATSIIEATPSDQATSSWALDNDASGFLKVLSANVLRTILNVVRGNATTGKAVVTLGDSGDTSILTAYLTVGAGSSVPAATVNGDLTAATLPANSIDAGTLPGGVSVLHVKMDDGGVGTTRTVTGYLGTTDPTTYATINEGDLWIDG